MLRASFLVLLSSLTILYLSQIGPQPVYQAPILNPLDSYDYIIAGGGLSGLVVACRLTEDPKTTVLVIEHGYLDERDPGILVPGLTRMGLDYSKYLYNVTTVPQPGLNNRTAKIWAASVVGGGTTVNGMVFPRGAAADYDSWEQLGNPNWGWDGVLPFFKKSETFNPPSEDIAREFKIKYNNTAHGFNGPISSGFPNFLWPSMKNFFRAWEELDVSHSEDGNDGKAIGSYWMPHSITLTNQSRSYARQMYYDPASARPNLHLITGHVVDKVIFDSNLKAAEVKYLSREDGTVLITRVRKEVLLAAGTVHSPAILQRSGIGARKLLDGLGITTLVDLPGVGQNVQDHPALHFVFSFTSDLIPNAMMLEDSHFAIEQLSLYYSSRRGLFTNNRGIGMAMLPLSNITKDYRSIIEAVVAQDPREFLPPDVDEKVVTGFLAQRDIYLKHFGAQDAAALEITYEGRAEFDAALQRPLSRGTILINTTDPLTSPIVDPRVLTNPADLAVAIASVRKTREFMNTRAMQELGAVEHSPGADISSDDAIEAAIRRTLMLPTFGHMSGSCSMQKERYGGVVSPRLLVYGVHGLRVIDASIMPLVATTHLQATVYMMAEKAASLIQEDN